MSHRDRVPHDQHDDGVRRSPLHAARDLIPRIARSRSTRATLVGLALTVWLDPQQEAQSQARPVGTSGVRQAPVEIALSAQHACARVSDGTAQCWGLNPDGQLGVGDTAPRAAPTALRGLRGVASVRVAPSRSCALSRAGVLSCWGSDASGFTHPVRGASQRVPLVLRGIAAVAAFDLRAHATCIVRRNGTVGCWEHAPAGITLGTPQSSSVTVPPPVVTDVPSIANAMAVTIGTQHRCVLRADASVWCWGRNSGGELGDGTYRDSPTPRIVFGTGGVTQIAGGPSHTCARIDDGTVRCWGRNDDAQLGDGSRSARIEPTAVAGLSHVVEVAVGESHGCARLDDGTVRCWGANDSGQLGDGTLVGRETHVSVRGLSTVRAVFAGGRSSCALRANGTMLCWGANGGGQLGDGTRDNRSEPVPVVPAAVATPRGRRPSARP